MNRRDAMKAAAVSLFACVFRRRYKRKVMGTDRGDGKKSITAYAYQVSETTWQVRIVYREIDTNHTLT